MEEGGRGFRVTRIFVGLLPPVIMRMRVFNFAPCINSIRVASVGEGGGGGVRRIRVIVRFRLHPFLRLPPSLPSFLLFLSTPVGEIKFDIGFYAGELRRAEFNAA